MADAFDFDLFVIGGGSGGVRAARVAAGEHGAKVGLAEDDRYGGTCVIRGCVPKKLMVFASGYNDLVDEAASYGWAHQKGGFDWPVFRQKLEAELDRLEGIYRRLLAGSGVETFDQRATLQDAHTVALADGTTKTAKHILIATGGYPVRPNIPNADLGIVSDDLFHQDVLPNKMLIVGGGYIACEFAGVMNGLGVEVTQFYRGDQVLRGFDNEARALVAEQMVARGVDLRLNTNIAAMEKVPTGVSVTDTAGAVQVFDQVLFATGRAPSSRNMGLHEVGITLGLRGEIPVNDYSQTAVPSIYAIGDVTDRVNLTPVAIREGMAFVQTVFAGNPTPVDHELIASAVFTQPEMGTVGISEEEAAALDFEVEVYSTSFRPMQTSFAEKEDQVMMKLLVAKEARTVLGCHMVAPAAGELIQLVGIAVKAGLTKEQFDATCAVHPTMSEELVTMRNPTRLA